MALLRRLIGLLLGYLGLKTARAFPSALHPLMQLASLHREDFVVDIAPDGNAVLIGVSARRSLSAAKVDSFMTEVVAAVAAVDTVDKALVAEQLFGTRRIVHCTASVGVLLRRVYGNAEVARQAYRELRDKLSALSMSSVLVQCR